MGITHHKWGDNSLYLQWGFGPQWGEFWDNIQFPTDFIDVVPSYLVDFAIVGGAGKFNVRANVNNLEVLTNIIGRPIILVGHSGLGVTAFSFAM